LSPPTGDLVHFSDFAEKLEQFFRRRIVPDAEQFAQRPEGAARGMLFRQLDVVAESASSLVGGS
jgi:hypothetical protein